MQLQPKNLTEDVKFYHIRYTYPVFSGIDEEGEFNYKLAIDNMGGKTVAFTRNPDDTVNYAVAVCSDKENYHKKVGRQIAAGRLAVGKCVTSTWEEFQDYVAGL